jgi:glutathione S-transferase/RNA polymerase-associated protein
VPALDHDGFRIFDSSVIQEYIEDAWPEPPLLPKSATERARVRMIEEIMDTQYEAITWGFMEVRVFGRASGALADLLGGAGQRQLAGLHQWLERQLGDRQWFNGETVGYGELAVVPFVQGAVAYRAGAARGTPLSQWLERMMARPSVKQTSDEARASAQGVNTGGPQAVQAGTFKREYRDHRLEWMVRSGGLQVVADGLTAGNIRFGRELD